MGPITPNPMLQTLNLNRNPLGNRGAAFVADALAANAALTELQLNTVGFGRPAADAFASLFQENSVLYSLDMIQNHWDCAAALTLARSLVDNRALHFLQLGELLAIPVQVLRGGGRVQQHTLDWTDKRAVAIEGIFVGTLLARNTVLTTLVLRGNRLHRNERGMRVQDAHVALANALRVNTTLTKLDLRHTGMDYRLTQQLAMAVRSNETLRMVLLLAQPLMVQQLKGRTGEREVSTVCPYMTWCEVASANACADTRLRAGRSTFACRATRGWRHRSRR